MTDSVVAGRPGYGAVLASREFRALWAVHVTSVLGDQVTRIVLASVVLARTGSVALSALSFATTFLPWLVGGPLLSVFADRCPRRTVMITCDVGRGLLVLAMTLPGVPVWGLFALAAAAALLGPPFEAARGATLPDVLPAEHYPVAQSLSMASLQVAQLAGFALGGLLVTAAPGPWALQVDAATFLLSALVIRRWCVWRPGRAPGGGTSGGGTSVGGSARAWLGDSAQGLRVVAGSPELRRLLAVCCVVAAVTVVPESLAVAQADALGTTPLVAGLLCAALPLGTAAGAVVLGRGVPAERRLPLVRPLALLAAAACAASLLRPGLTGLLLLWTVAGVGAACQMPANVAFVLRLDPDVRGRALSVAQVLLQGSQGLAIALSGVVAGRVGPSAAVGWAGALGLLALLVRLPRRTARAVDAAAAAATLRVRLLTVLVAGAAGVLWWAAGRHAPALAGPLDLPAWALLPMVVGAQAFVVHFQVRRQAQGISLCHLPLVIGLVCTGPAAFVVVRTVGGALAMAGVRGQRGIKLAFNTAAYALEAVVAVSLLHALAGWPTPLALFAVMALADLTSFTAVSVAIMVFERRVDAAAWLRPLSWLVPINLVATSFALLALAALWRGEGYLLLLGAVTGVLLLFYRTYARLRGRHLDLGRLQDLAASLPALTPEGQELRDILERTRVLLVAESAELLLPDGTVVLATQDSGGDARPADPRSRASGCSVLSTRIAYDDRRLTATLTTRDRLGAVRLFDEGDRRLLDAVGALIGGGLDRGADRQRMLDTARRDPLTGLWTLPEATRRANGTAAGGLLIVDIIGLQDVNDSLGHEAGDALLRLAAQRLQDAVGSGALTARIGGDELLAVLTAGGASPEQVVRDVTGTVEVGGAQLELRVRGGYCGPQAETFELGLRHAQAALARAAAGGTRYRAWSPELSVDPTRRLRLAGDLQGALQRGEVVAVFQPLCRAEDLVVVGAEALARWRHPELGPVPPDEFVAIAEQTGLIGELTAAVLEDALRQARHWRAEGLALRVSVNLSPRSLGDGLPQLVRSALDRHALPPEALLLEITESSIMSDLEQAQSVLSEVRAHGVEIALDDFGTGHSSLTHLRVLPVDEIKLDRSFLTHITTDPTARRIVATAVSLCRDLGKVVVAEGVEDQDTADLLHALGVDLLQGYHLGRPLPAAEWSWLPGSGQLAVGPRQVSGAGLAPVG